MQPGGTASLNSPRGITVNKNPLDSEGNTLLVFIANSGANNIIILSCNKNDPSFFTVFDIIDSTRLVNSPKSKTFNQPAYVWYNEQCKPGGYLYVVDQYNSRIVAFYYDVNRKNFQYMNEFGTLGYNNDELCLPSYLFVKENDFYVLDLCNRAIKIFVFDVWKKKYNFKEAYPSSYDLFPQELGANPGQMWMPVSIDVDAKLNLYVSDMTLNRVLIFNRSLTSYLDTRIFKVIGLRLICLKNKLIKLLGLRRFLYKHQRGSKKMKKIIKNNKREFQKALTNYSKVQSDQRNKIYSSIEYQQLQSEYIALLQEVSHLINIKAVKEKIIKINEKISEKNKEIIQKFPELFNI